MWRMRKEEKIRKHEQALYCISEVMHSKRHHKKVETSFFVGSVEEISMSLYWKHVMFSVIEH
jgi:hypothetical protein